MHDHWPLPIAVLLSLAACTDTLVQESNRNASAAGSRLTVRIVEASGGG